MPLQLISLLADTLDPFYRALADYLTRNGVSVEFHADRPWPEREAMLLDGEADVGFVCGLPYVRQGARPSPPLVLLAAPVMRGPRYEGRPIYYSDVVVRQDHAATTFADLKGTTWGFNHLESHSGYNAVACHLTALAEASGFFQCAEETGSHEASLEAVLDGTIDGAAIDSMVLDLERARRPQLNRELRVLLSLGPSPSPPVVMGRPVTVAVRERVRALLLGMHQDPSARPVLDAGLLERYAPVTDADYDPIRRMDDVACEVSLT